MATKTSNVVVEHCVVNASPDVAFTVLTSAVDIAGWLSNEARCEAHPGGRFELWWNTGYVVRGTVKDVQKPKLFSVSWQGSGEPRETTVTFTLAPEGDDTEVTVRHSGFGRGAKWAAAVEESRKGWRSSLKNLVYLIKSGIDLREASRPMLGVMLGESPDAGQVAKDGAGATPGVYLAGVIDGLSAQAAGLSAHDLLVAVGGRPTPDYRSISAALQGCVAGDRVEVAFVRGKECRSVTLELKPRPMPELPFYLPALLTMLRERYAKANVALDQALAGASEEAAGRSPSDGEWSAKQVIAHLCATERFNQHYTTAAALVGDQVLNTPGNPTAVAEAVAAVLATVPGVASLRKRLVEEQEMTLGMVAAMRPEIVANRARYRRIAFGVYDLIDHIDEHAEQIKAALAAG